MCVIKFLKIEGLNQNKVGIFLKFFTKRHILLIEKKTEYIMDEVVFFENSDKCQQ